MPQNFLSADRDQGMLLAPDIREWLPKDHLAWFVIEVVEGLDLAPIFADYRADGHGRAAHDPQMMSTLLLYAYCTRTRSSRGIERACETDIAFRIIAANRQPDHATIARFQARHQERLAALFGQVLSLCARAGLTAGQALAVDSTALAGNASPLANRTHSQIAAEIVAANIAADEAEDAELGSARGDEVLPEIGSARQRQAWIKENLEALRREHESRPMPSARPERLAECKARLENQHEVELQAERAYRATRKSREASLGAGKRLTGRPPAGGSGTPDLQHRQINTTDPDSASVGHHHFKQGYRAQAVCTEAQVIVACELHGKNGDGGQLEPMIDAAHANLTAIREPHPPRVLADAGYWSEVQIEALGRRGLEVLVPPDRARQSRPVRMAANPSAKRQRERLREPEVAARYRARQKMIEPIFGQMKHNRGFERLSRRGAGAARAEWSLICLTHNLLKLFAARPAGALA